MAYDYVKRAYHVVPNVGDRVRHAVINKEGTITRESPSQGHYVMVKFDGDRHSSPCHPTELEYLTQRERWAAELARANN